MGEKLTSNIKVSSRRASLVVALAVAILAAYSGFIESEIDSLLALVTITISAISVLMLQFSAVARKTTNVSWLAESGMFLAFAAVSLYEPFSALWYISGGLLATGGYIQALAPLIVFAGINGYYFSEDQLPTNAELITQTITTLAVMGVGLFIGDVKPGKTSKKDDEGPKFSSKKPISEQLDPNILLESIADGIFVVDNDEQIQLFSHAAETITGWTTEDVIGLDFRSVMALIDGEGKELINSQNPVSIALSTGEVTKGSNTRLKTHSQKAIDISLVVSPIKDESGRVMAAVGIFRDVTQEKHEEKQRAEFISTASHEMRTPVAAIEGYLALSMNDRVAKIDSKAREYLEKAHSSTQHLGKLFQDLLTAAKSEDGRLTNHPQVIEAGAFLDEIIEGVRFTAEKKGLLLIDGTREDEEAGQEVVRPLAYINVDSDRMREVLTNLFDNAVKYTEEGKITINMSVNDKDVIFSVTDTGQGIPAEDQPHLFQKFYRVDNTATRQIGGTGLGLFISRKIVELYRGRIWVESVMEEGSTFFVSIPKLSPEEAQSLQKQQAAETPLNQVGSTPKI